MRSTLRTVLKKNFLNLRIGQKHPSLFGPFVSYEAKKVLQMRPEELISQNQIFVQIFSLFCKLDRFKIVHNFAQCTEMAKLVKRMIKFNTKKVL